MRDKNLTLNQFNIQLEKSFHLVWKPTDDRFSRIHVLDTPTLQLLENSKIRYPRDFRLLRSLSIIQWYLPEVLHWKVLLDLKMMSFSHLNQKQRIELTILLESREIMEIFLYETERYSSREIFGNILGNDLRDLQREIKISKIYPKRKISKVRRRGYQDHGSRRPDHKWLPSEDWTLTEYQNLKEKKLKLQQKTTNRLLRNLRELLSRSKF